MSNNKITAAKANMMQMAKNGGLAGFMKGGGAYDGLMKAQPGREIIPEGLRRQQDVNQLLKNLSKNKGPRELNDFIKTKPQWKTQPGVNMPKPQLKNAKSSK